MQPFSNLNEYEPKKNRDIKISLDDLYFLLSQIHNQVAAHGEDVSEDDYENITRIFNKYLVLSTLRDEEAFWYDVMQKIDSGKIENMTLAALSDYRRAAYEFYIDARQKREAVQKEL